MSEQFSLHTLLRSVLHFLGMIAADVPHSGKRVSNKVHVEKSESVAAQNFGMFSSWRATRRFNQCLLVDLKTVKGDDLTVSTVVHVHLSSVARCNSSF